MSRTYSALRTLTVLSSLGAVLLSSHVRDARAQNANWPPDPSVTDLSDPATWPDDPGYHYCPSPSPYCADDQERDGQWNYYSFIPVSTGGPGVRPDETASGMSIDLAWRYSIGDDRVRIAVMDSGINWDSGDLIERAWLNPAELANHKPTLTGGVACGGENELAGYDCNGDGIFNVTDYVETEVLQPPESEGHPRGDMNQNGVLDAGDLILNFSDGVDDDGNGYIDDISGWDFLKDDNNPYDDTRYGHGTGEARDSVATGNDGIGAIGGCPHCRFIPMRVADSFIGDVTAFGQAVVYAVDNGAKVVQCALGTVNMNQFAQQALDYAYFHNVVSVTSMADENSRHHNVPATANHSLPVHAIYYDGSSPLNSASYLDFNPCTNFGGQNLLSASGTGCSSEAVGQLSGMTGLLFSVALQNGYPDLTAGEVFQLWMQTADDIYVPESQDPDSFYKWSQPGFDQRFGYGRVNANTAVEQLLAGKIPPEVDVVRPYWFEVLYPDQLTGPVEINGTISARRANTYDYVVEWAPGVQPLDDAFTKISGMENIPSNQITGADGPIALFDVRTIDVTHEPDSDSLLGENQYTITVRVRAIAHYGGDVGDVTGELRRTYYVHRDPDLVAGFPIHLGSSGESSPKMADIDGDGQRDLIYPTTDGRIHVFRLTDSGPEYVDGFPFVGERVDGLEPDLGIEGKPNYLDAPGYIEETPPTMGAHVDPRVGGSSYTIAPAIADLDGDGTNEIVAATYNGKLYVIDNKGQMRPGFPVRLPEVPSCPRDGTEPEGLCMDTYNVVDRGSFAAPVLADMDKDGDLDIIFAGFDGFVYVYDRDGQLLDGWPVEVHYDGKLYTPEGQEPLIRGRIFTTPAVADFNGDGYPEILVGSNEPLGNGGQAGAAYLIDGRGNNAPSVYPPNWPVTMTSFNIFPLVAEGVTISGVVGEFDGTLSAVQYGTGSVPWIMPFDPGAQSVLSGDPPNLIPTREDGKKGVEPTSIFGEHSKAVGPDVMFPAFSNPSLGDIDQDGILDVIASGSSLSVLQTLLGSSNAAGQQMIGAWSGATGKMLPGAPFILEDFSFFNSHAIADLNNDDYPEIVAGSAGYYLHAYDGCGREPAGWPKFTGQWMTATPAVGDLDGDGTLEVAVATRAGWLYLWHTKGDANGQIQWESFRHDNRNTGNFGEPLEHGDAARRAAEPLTNELCATFFQAEIPPPPLEPGGGCGSCAVGSDQRDDEPIWLLALAGVGLAVARRRRR